MKKRLAVFIFFAAVNTAAAQQSALAVPEETNKQISSADTSTEEVNTNYTVFDDKMLIDGYAQKFKNLSKNILFEMIKDDTLTSYKTAAAIRIFRENFSEEVVGPEKNIFEKFLIRRFNRDDSPFVQVEIMNTLCRMDRYKYFGSLAPALIQKLDHYNSTVNEIAYQSLDELINSGNARRTREARVIFETLRKVLFLSRKRLANITEPGPKLSQKLKLLRWSIKILGNQELNRLPKEVINLF